MKIEPLSPPAPNTGPAPILSTDDPAAAIETTPQPSPPTTLPKLTTSHSATAFREIARAQAASVVQSLFRGFVVKKEFDTERENTKKQKIDRQVSIVKDLAAVRIQGWARGCRGSRLYSYVKRVKALARSSSEEVCKRAEKILNNRVLEDFGVSVIQRAKHKSKVFNRTGESPHALSKRTLEFERNLGADVGVTAFGHERLKPHGANKRSRAIEEVTDENNALEEKNILPLGGTFLEKQKEKEKKEKRKTAKITDFGATLKEIKAGALKGSPPKPKRTIQENDSAVKNVEEKVDGRDAFEAAVGESSGISDNKSVEAAIINDSSRINNPSTPSRDVPKPTPSTTPPPVAEVEFVSSKYQHEEVVERQHEGEHAAHGRGSEESKNEETVNVISYDVNSFSQSSLLHRPSIPPPLYTTLLTPRAQVVITCHKTEFNLRKAEELRMAWGEVVKIFAALDILAEERLDALKERADKLFLEEENKPEEGGVPLILTDSLKDLSRSFEGAWQTLDATNATKISADLIKETKKHLCGLIKLPAESIQFLKANKNIRRWEASDWSEYLRSMGVKPSQFLKCPEIQKDGATFQEITPSTLSSLKNVLKSSVMRRRILVGVGVAGGVRTWEDALRQDRLKKKFQFDEPAPAVVGDGKENDSNLVQELRKSVGELQMSLYSKENTITRLTERVVKITEKAERAGVVLSPPVDEMKSNRKKWTNEETTTTTTTTTKSPPRTPGGRPLYRIDMEENAEASVTLLPLPNSPKNVSKTPTAVSKTMWSDPRVSPSKEIKKYNTIALPFNGNRQQMMIPTATFSANQMSVTTGSPNHEGPVGFLGEDKKAEKKIHNFNNKNNNLPTTENNIMNNLTLDYAIPSITHEQQQQQQQQQKLIRRGSPMRGRPRPKSAAHARAASKNITLAPGTSARGADVVTELIIGFEEAKEGVKKTRKKRRKKGRGGGGGGGCLMGESMRQNSSWEPEATESRPRRRKKKKAPVDQNLRVIWTSLCIANTTTRTKII